MQDSVKEFFSNLHQEHLKPKGYKKVRHTFSRGKEGYTERFQFQGSAWNDSSQPWRFYINVGVEFPDLERRDCGFPGTHCSARIESLLRDAPAQYDLPISGSEEFATLIAGYIERASEQMGQQIQAIRRAYEETKSERLKVA